MYHVDMYMVSSVHLQYVSMYVVQCTGLTMCVYKVFNVNFCFAVYI